MRKRSPLRRPLALFLTPVLALTLVPFDTSPAEARGIKFRSFSSTRSAHVNRADDDTRGRGFGVRIYGFGSGSQDERRPRPLGPRVQLPPPRRAPAQHSMGKRPPDPVPRPSTRRSPSARRSGTTTASCASRAAEPATSVFLRNLAMRLPGPSQLSLARKSGSEENTSNRRSHSLCPADALRVTEDSTDGLHADPARRRHPRDPEVRHVHLRPCLGATMGSPHDHGPELGVGRPSEVAVTDSKIVNRHGPSRPGRAGQDLHDEASASPSRVGAGPLAERRGARRRLHPHRGSLDHVERSNVGGE